MDILKKTPRKDPLRLIYEESLASPSEIYHETSKLTPSNIRGFRRRMQRVLGQEYFLRRISQAYKTYPTSPRVALPALSDATEQTTLARSLHEIIVGRRSCREYTGRELSVTEIATLMRNAYGVTGRAMLPHGIEQKMRAVPSGGALFPLELYAVCFRVAGVEPGIYHYRVLDHELELVKPGQHSEEFGRAFFYEEMFRRLGALIVITGILKRSSIKYSERGYRFMVLEAGHVGQNLCLTASALRLGNVMLGGFMDNDVNDLIGIDGVNESTLYAAAFGGV